MLEENPQQDSAMTIAKKKKLKELKKKSWAEAKKLEQLKKSSKKAKPCICNYCKKGISSKIAQKLRSSEN